MVNCVVYAVRLVIVAKKNIFDFDAVLFLFSNLIYKSYYRFFVFEFLLCLVLLFVVVFHFFVVVRLKILRREELLLQTIRGVPRILPVWRKEELKEI